MLPAVVNYHGFTNVLSVANKAVGIDFNNSMFNSGGYFVRESGKQCLYDILKGLLSISTRRKVIIQSYTCYSVAKVFEVLDLDVEILDTNPDTLDYYTEQLSSAVDENTLCIVFTNLFGSSANLNEISKKAKDQGVYLVEDSAQNEISFNSDNSFADLVFYSFSRGKFLSVMGGGLIKVNNKDLLEKVSFTNDLKPKYGFSYLLKMTFNDLMTNPMLYWFPANLPFLGIGATVYPDQIEMGTMSKVQLSFLENSLGIHREDIRSRCEIAKKYTEFLEKNSNQKLIMHTRNELYAPNRYPFYAKTSIEELSAKKMQVLKNLGVVPMYPKGINKLDQIKKNMVYTELQYDGVDYITSHLFTAPLHKYVTNKKINNIFRELLKII